MMYGCTPLFRWFFLVVISLPFLSACSRPDVLPPDLADCRARPDRFHLTDTHTVLDTCTQLMWMTQDYRNLEGQAPTRWLGALAWSDKMNQQRFGGYADWRPATLEDYRTIYYAPASKRSYRGKHVGYPDAFADGGGEWYWVKEVAVWGSWHVHQAHTYSFRNGRTDSRWVHTEDHPQALNSAGSVRLLRGPISTASLKS